MHLRKFTMTMIVMATAGMLLLCACQTDKQPEQSADVSGESVTSAVDEPEADVNETEATEETIPATPTCTPTPTPFPVSPDTPEIEGYNILWADEFDGDELNTDIWNYQLRAPGWTNNELQRYTDSEENVYVEDGHLVIRATRTENEDGSYSYSSGKIDGRLHTDFLYGRVVVSAKVPEGQGLWPAIWMMPTVENRYGSWPRCGEIDIMEILGHQPETTYSTIHYGNPHAEQQGSLTLQGETFADSFHEFIVEWEPGVMRFYVDDILIHEVNDWYSATSENSTPKDFPAPFNQLFYLQLNLAVGGNWPGDPDETTDFDNATFEVDYVRVYQKDFYDENVSRPEVTFRDADETGNYVINGDLMDDSDDLNDLNDWSLILNQGGSATGSISDGVLTVNTTDAGEVDYSVQLANWDIPLLPNEHYVLTFEARADEERQTNVCITGPRANYVRYLEDTTVDLSTDWQTYTYEFDMNATGDAYGRLEYNMGATDSTASVQIRNVRIEMQ